jgi:SpoVK/Ycf46/Vps4 family AAA+-type ATPase
MVFKTSNSSFVKESGLEYLNLDLDLSLKWRISKKNIDMSVFSKNIQKFIDNDLKISLNYLGKHLNKRSYLFTGPPGTGKTSLIRSLIQLAPKSVSIIIVNHNSIEYLERVLKNKCIQPALIIIEDIDLLLDENKTKQSVLNFLDGLDNSTQAITIMTTNHPEKVIGEVRDRPGRVDRIVHIGHGDLEARQGQIISLWNDKPCPISIKEFAEVTNGMTVAMLAEIRKRADIYSNFGEVISEEIIREILNEIVTNKDVNYELR